MANLVRLLAVLGKINPAVFDAIFPHGPVGPHGLAVRRFSPGAEVALNPQPLPPKEALLVASAEVAHDIAFAAVSAQAAGNRRRRAARRAGDRRVVRHAPAPAPDPVARPVAVPVAARARAAPRLGHRRLARRRRARAGPGRLAVAGGRRA